MEIRMTILTSNEVPLGLRGLAILLIGIGSLWFLVFVIITELIIILCLGKSNVKEYFMQNEN